MDRSVATDSGNGKNMSLTYWSIRMVPRFGNFAKRRAAADEIRAEVCFRATYAAFRTKAAIASSSRSRLRRLLMRPFAREA